MSETQRTEVVVVGAGPAGLSAARHLVAAGVEVTVLEAGPEPGGRVRTDVVDGFTVDHGFQRLCTDQPQVVRQLDPGRLDLRPFAPGVLLYTEGRRHRIADQAGPDGPWSPKSALRNPRRAFSTLRPHNHNALSSAFQQVAQRSPAEVLASRDTSADRVPALLDLSPALGERTVRPLLAALLHDPDLASSGRFAELVLRSFLRGRSVLPAGGMGRIPAQLAAVLPAGTVKYGVRVLSVSTDRVVTDTLGEVRARAVVVATDPGAALELLPGLRRPAFHAVTTIYHVADSVPPVGSGSPDMWLLDADGRGPVAHSAVLSAVAPSYAPMGRTLIASTVLGHDGQGLDKLELRARERLAVLYGSDTRTWRHLTTHHLPYAVPVVEPGHNFRRPVRVLAGLYVCGDHRDSSTLQGALASGARAARSALADLGVAAVPLPRPGRNRAGNKRPAA